jgi:hypothetical protein
MSIVGIDHVQLAMPDGGEDQVLAIYVGALGSIEVPKPESLAIRGSVWFESSAAKSSSRGGKNFDCLHAAFAMFLST